MELLAGKRVDLTGLEVTCKSDEAVEHYNEAVKLCVGKLASYLPSIERALAADPDFVMARCFQATYYCDALQFDHPKVEEDLKYLQEVYNSSNVTDRERRHIDVVKLFAQQNHPEVCSQWGTITIHYPQDMYAANWAFFVSRKTGQFDMAFDVMARAVHHCPKESSLYPYILSLYAFTLEETNQRDKAEHISLESISIQPKNPYAIHTMSHVFEEEREAIKGVEFLTACRDNWETTPFGPHIAWHLMLYYLDLNEVDKIFPEYDKMQAPAIASTNILRLLDTASILWRLNLAGIDPGAKRWEQVTEAFKSRIGNCQLSWVDCHLMMSLSYGKITESTARLTLAREMIKAIEEHSSSNNVYDCSIARKLGVPLCNALLAFGEERYSDVIKIIPPLKYDIIHLGGSGAQRQIFDLTLIHAAIRGEQYNEAMAFIVEMKARKPHSKYLQRLYDQVSSVLAK